MNLIFLKKSILIIVNIDILPKHPLLLLFLLFHNNLNSTLVQLAAAKHHLLH
jgi:hypothetical protein